MRIESRDRSREELILFGLVHNTEVIAHIAARLQLSQTPRQNAYNAAGGHFTPQVARLLRGNDFRTITQLALDYYQQYGEAPGSHLDAILRCWGEEQQDQTLLDSVESVWSKLSQNREKSQGLNAAYILDLFNKHYRERSLRLLAEDIVANLDRGSSDDAEEKIFSYLDQPVSRTLDHGSFLLNDDARISQAFAQSHHEILIHYPGGMGEFLGVAPRRGCFLSIIAPEKTGKSSLLMDMAYRALLERRRVAFFELGDMTEQQTILRWAARMSGRPIFPVPNNTVKWPTSMDTNGLPSYENRPVGNPIDEDEVFQARDRLVNHFVKSKNPYFYLSNSPAGTRTVASIESELRMLERKHYWIPDIVVIDYGDLLAPPKGRKLDKRDEINETWMQMRALSERRNILLLTATQCNREGYDAKGGLRLKHVSEEKRKASHVSMMIGMVCTEDDKARGVFRINCPAARDIEYNPSRLCYAAGCLALGHPAVVSVFPQLNNPSRNSHDSDSD